LVGLPHDEGSGQASANIGQGQTDQIGVLAETLVVARGKGAGGRRALCQDDHEQSKGRGNQSRYEWPAPLHCGQTQVWQATRNGSDHMHLLVESERPTYYQGADRRDQGSRNLLRNHFEADDDRQDAKRDRQFVAVGLSELLKIGPELSQRAVTTTLQAQHAGDLPQRDLNADASQEPDQHGARKKVGEESQAHEARENQEKRSHQSKHTGQREVMV